MRLLVEIARAKALRQAELVSLMNSGRPMQWALEGQAEPAEASL